MPSCNRGRRWHAQLPAKLIGCLIPLLVSTATPGDLVGNIAIAGGSSSNMRILSKVLLNCTVVSPTQDAPRASVLFRDSLIGVQRSLQASLQGSKQGVDIEFSPAAPSLLSISYPGNIVIADSQLTSIHA